MITQLKVNVKKFTKKDGTNFYALSTKLFKTEDTAKTSGEWYKVYPTKEMKAILEEKSIKLNRPFMIEINTDCISIDSENKKLFLLADKDFVINYIQTEQPEENKIPKFESVFQVVKVG